MFGFLKGKAKNNKNYPNQDVNGKSPHSKDKNKKPSKEKKDRQKCKQNDARDASQPSSSFFKKGGTLPSHTAGACVSVSPQQRLSNGLSSQSCVSLDQSSTGDNQNTSSEVSDICSKSSSCRNSFALSASSSRASIPSITTEFVDEDRTSSHSSSTPKLNKQSVIENKPMHSEKLLTMKPSTQTHLRHTTQIESMKDANVYKVAPKNSVSNGTSPKPPLSPRSVPPGCIDLIPPLPRTFSNDDEDTSVSSSIYSAPPSPGLAVSSSTSEMNFSRPTSPEEKRSLVSTPSTSNSSLSSLSVRPTSPSGRKTPPGPKMGTNVKLGASPTASRKATRPNIKTNPNASSSLSISKSSIKQKPPQDMVQHSHLTVTPKNIVPTNGDSASPTRENTKSADDVIPSFSDVNNSHEMSTQKSLVTNKPRHSASSVQSLESIPEGENDNVTSETDHHRCGKQNGEHSSNTDAGNGDKRSSVNSQDIVEESNPDDKCSKTFMAAKGKNPNQEGSNITTKEAFDNLRDAIAKEKQFADLILRDYLECRNDDDSSESYREPEVKEHRLELIPDCFGMMNSLTFTTDKLSETKEKRMAEDKQECGVSEDVKSTCEPSSQSDPESSSSLSLKNATPTHAVFQIPLRSKSCSRERSESPCSKLTTRNTSPTVGPGVTNTDDDNLQLTVRNITGDDESSEVGCVEGHVELNFDRGRKSEKSKDSQRHRSLSSARRQKLYDDIKKFTAETKEMKIKDTASGVTKRLSEGQPNATAEHANFKESSSAIRKDNLRDVMRQLSSSETTKSTRSKSTSSQRRVVSTLPRTAPKKLERSITVADIKVNVNGKQSSPLRDSSHVLPAKGNDRPSNDSSTRQLKVFHGRSKSDMDETVTGERVTPCGGSYPFLAGKGDLDITFCLEKINLLDGSNSLSSRSDKFLGKKIMENELHGNTERDLCDSSMSTKHKDLNRSNFEPKTKTRSKTKLSQSDGKLNDLQRRRSTQSGSAIEREANAPSDWYTVELLRKELAAIQAKYESEVEALRKSLARKEEELTTSRSQATEAAEALARSREEQLKIKAQLTKEKEEIEEKHRKEREREERERREREEKERKEAEERRKKEDEEEAERKRKEQDVQKKSSESEGTEDGEDDEEGGGEEEKETEAESNKRKIEKMHMEMLLLKQQNEEFEEMVREKYRRQVELELQIGEINNEVTQKEAAIQSVRVELSYAKNETALTQAKVKQLEEELLEQKQRVEALEKELDTAERELKRMEILQEKLRVTEGRRNELQAHIDEIELERDEEIKIIQDALDEAAQEREELLATFEKEIEKLNSLNAARETQMLQEFEDKLKELEQQHKSKLEEKDREAKTALQRSKRMADEEDVRQRLERLKSDLNSEWEDKLRSECARLKSELDSLHSEEKHLAVESIRVQKEQELQEVRKGVDGKVETLNKEISELKKSLAAKDEFYQQEIDEIRTRADRDVWELRRKLQKLDEASYDRQQLLEDKHREDLERLREEYADKMAGLEAQLSCVDVRGLTDLRAKLEAVHKQQMEHLGEQHRLSMERLRDELEAEKVQAAEEARVIVSRHHEYINESLKEQLAEAVTANTQYREEIEAIKFALCRREEVIKSLEEDLAKLKASKGGSPSAGSPPPTAGGQASPTAFQFPHEGSQGSRSSQDRLSNDADDDGHKGSGLLGKMFGGGWFSGTRARDSTTPANSPLSTGSSKKNRQST